MKAPSDHIRTLQRRVDFLKSREHKNSFDLAELGALEWALVNLPSNPAAWIGLTEDEINRLRHLVDWTAEWSYGRFAYELEQLLKEKNA